MPLSIASSTPSFPVLPGSTRMGYTRAVITCPHCQARYRPGGFKPGQRVRCARCKQEFRVPEASLANLVGKAGGGPARPVNMPVPGANPPPPPPLAPRPAPPPPIAPAAPSAPAPVGPGHTAPKPATLDDILGGPPPPPPAASAPSLPPPPPLDALSTTSRWSDPRDMVGGEQMVSPSPASQVQAAGNGRSGRLVVPGYEIIGKLASGGMATVYKARQISLDRDVAIKVLSPDLIRNEKFISRFTKEAQALSALNHPNIVGIIDRGNQGDTYYLVMEYVAGTTLRFMIEQVDISLRNCIDLTKQVCLALEYAHSKGIIHRDVKPENIIIAKGRQVKLADFGLAGMVGVEAANATQLTKTTMGMGTFNYMSPEQRVPNGKVDYRSDVFSLGVTFYEILTGQLPIGRFDPPSTFNRLCDARLDEIVLRSLKTNPDDRYPTAAAFRADLERYVSRSKARSKPVTEAKARKPITRPPSRVKVKQHDLSNQERNLWEAWKTGAEAAQVENALKGFGKKALRGSLADAHQQQKVKAAKKGQHVGAGGQAIIFGSPNQGVDDDRKPRGAWKRYVPLLLFVVVVLPCICIGLARFLPWLYRIPGLGSLMRFYASMGVRL